VGFAPTFYFGGLKMDSAGINERLRSIAAKAASDNRTEFVHSEIAGTKRNMTLRIFIDKLEGVTIEDCTNVSRAIEEVLDADDFIPGKYVLEVSSPGIERGLYDLRDFERFTGKKARVKTSGEINGQRNFVGEIVGVENGSVIFDDRTAGSIRIPYEQVDRANLKFDLQDEFRKH
jgi:ribosome maturation factor RimP